MQTTSSGWSELVRSSFRQINTGVFISWLKTLASGVNFFTINTSVINGTDFIKGGNNIPSVLANYRFDEYTDFVKNWSVERQIGQFPFGLIMAQADVELDNTSKLFLPGYDSTIGSGILPGRPLRISLGISDESLLQFTGFTGQPELYTVERKVDLHAFDVMDYIYNYNFMSISGTTFSGMLTNQYSSSGIAYYLEKMGFDPTEIQFDASLQDPIGFINVTDRKFGDVLRDLVEAEAAIMMADENGVPQFWNRQHFNTTSGLGSRFALSYENCIDIQYSHTPIINDVRVVAKPRSVQINAPVYESGNVVEIPAGTTVDVLVNFSDNDGQLPVLTVVEPTAGTSTSSYYTTNTQADDNGSAVDSFISLDSVYLFGTSYRMRFTSTYTATAYLTKIVLYGNAAKVTASIDQRYIDQESIDSYGRNPANNGEPYVISNDYIQREDSALSLAFLLVSQFAQPNRHFDVETFSDPSRQIGDFGTLYIPETNETKRVWITGKVDKLNPDGNLTQVLSLEERTLYSYFTINQSLIGGSDVIAP